MIRRRPLLAALAGLPLGGARTGMLTGGARTGMLTGGARAGTLTDGARAATLSRPASAELPVPPGNRLSFHIIRKGSTIGEHILDFTRSGNALTVSVAVDIVVGFGPLVLFRYKHRATEQWQADQVVSIDSETNDDGTQKRMTVRRNESGLVIEGTQVPRYIAPPMTLPGTHWNRAMLNAPFINTENGRLMSPTVTLVGTEQVPVTGGSVEAQHFSLRGDVDLDTFYDLTPNWVGLRFTAKGGSEIQYLRA